MNKLLFYSSFCKYIDKIFSLRCYTNFPIFIHLCTYVYCRYNKAMMHLSQPVIPLWLSAEIESIPSDIYRGKFQSIGLYGCRF